MKNEIRIPTILGLLLLLIGIGVGVYLATQRQILFSQADISNAPKGVTVANINSTSASVYWTTDKEIPGFITAGLTSNNLDLSFNDERDTTTPQKHSLHFVTLNNLQPDTTYYFKIVSGGDQGETQSFKTSSEITPSSVSPLNGAVLDENLQPVSEALVVLELPGAQPTATITKSSGNFILSLATFKNEDLLSNVDLSTPVIANLKVFNLTKTSDLQVELPSTYDPSLPAIILGESRSLVPTKAPTPTPDPVLKYDVNGDKKLDDKDRTLIRSYFYSQKEEALKADFNSDGIVNQNDLSLFNNAASGL